ncbi:MAG: FtsW/RodA/SpoVE family cell cycle protein [Anaerolineales bacterium]|nr:FtsW/RodA/SpoVE family cell cycle protein [Anaerolineales bacterium]
MSLFRHFPKTALTDVDGLQARLLGLAGLFLGLYALALTLSPAARARSWQVDYRWEHWLGMLAWLVVFYLAHVQSARWLPRRDAYLLPLAGLLSGWGMLTIWRLLPPFGLRQSVWLLVAGAALVAGFRLDPGLGFLRRYKYLWLTSSLLLTALTLLLGVNPMGYGPRMWLGCCGVYLQPSEPLKLLLIAYLAAYMADRQPLLFLPGAACSPATIPLPSGAPAPAPLRASAPLLPLLAPTFIMTGLALALLVVQRDLGTATIFLLLYAAMVYVTSGRKSVLAVALLALAAAGVGGYALFDVVRIRVDAWLNPWLDPSGRSFQIVQSLLAIANGGLLGRGPGIGNPSLVPVAHSDLIYAAIAEEFGLLGSIGLLLTLALLAARGLRAAQSADDSYRRYLAAGLTVYLVGQALLIVGGSLRLLPLTGITLPFVSYGGSSLLVSCLALLLLLHVSNRPEGSQAPLRRPQPYLQVGAFLLAGLAAAALATGWWAIARGPALLTRTDNPRRAIADRQVRRGAILDRNNEPINATYGEPGELVRSYLYPPLSNVVGYTDPTYGQSGLEASLDATLRGEQGNPGLTIWWNHLLYGQPPPGLDVRLSLDLGLQRAADERLQGYSGALVLLNADSGEILALGSYPTFDANRLQDDWDALVARQDAPLLNRATLGRYPVADPQSSLFRDWVLESAAAPPAIRLPTGEQAGDGAGPLRLSPLQVALIAGAISNSGERPAPQLVMAVNTTQAGWAPLPALQEPLRVMDPMGARGLFQGLAQEDLGIWELTAVIRDVSGQPVSWYVGGKLPLGRQPGVLLAIALLLETDDSRMAAEIGRAMLAEARLQD